MDKLLSQFSLVKSNHSDITDAQVIRELSQLASGAIQIVVIPLGITETGANLVHANIIVSGHRFSGIGSTVEAAVDTAAQAACSYFEGLLGRVTVTNALTQSDEVTLEQLLLECPSVPDASPTKEEPFYSNTVPLIDFWADSIETNEDISPKGNSSLSDTDINWSLPMPFLHRAAVEPLEQLTIDGQPELELPTGDDWNQLDVLNCFNEAYHPRLPSFEVIENMQRQYPALFLTHSQLNERTWRSSLTIGSFPTFVGRSARERFSKKNALTEAYTHLKELSCLFVHFTNICRGPISAKENLIEGLIQEYKDNFKVDTGSHSRGHRYEVIFLGFHTFIGIGPSLDECKSVVFQALYRLLESLSPRYAAPKSVVLSPLCTKQMEPPVLIRNVHFSEEELDKLHLLSTFNKLFDPNASPLVTMEALANKNPKAFKSSSHGLAHRLYRGVVRVMDIPFVATDSSAKAAERHALLNSFAVFSHSSHTLLRLKKMLPLGKLAEEMMDELTSKSPTALRIIYYPKLVGFGVDIHFTPFQSFSEVRATKDEAKRAVCESALDYMMAVLKNVTLSIHVEEMPVRN